MLSDALQHCPWDKISEKTIRAEDDDKDEDNKNS